MNRREQDKSKEIFDLHKIPDHILNKQLLVEKGKTDAYIQELEHENKQLKAKLSQYEKQ